MFYLADSLGFTIAQEVRGGGSEWIRRNSQRNKIQMWGNVFTNTDTCPGTGSCLSSFVCSEVARMVNLPVAILQRSLPHGDHLGKAQQQETIVLTITSSSPHGSLSEADLRLSGHIIILKKPHKGPHKAEVSFLV